MRATERVTDYSRYTVYLNGVPQAGVVEANALQGWVVIRERDGDRLTQRTVYGSVRIEYGDETGG